MDEEKRIQHGAVLGSYLYSSMRTACTHSTPIRCRSAARVGSGERRRRWLEQRHRVALS